MLPKCPTPKNKSINKVRFTNAVIWGNLSRTGIYRFGRTFEFVFTFCRVHLNIGLGSSVG